MPSSFDDLYRTIDEEIREGHARPAREKLTKLVDEGKLPRPQAARFAYLSWRADLPLLGIRILNPIVRSDRKMPVEPQPDEKTEYAHCLIRIGAIEEALVILDTVPMAKLPTAYLYQASAHISRWQYEDALPALQKYVRLNDVPAYQKLVGKVNLAACYVVTRQPSKATYLLRELLHETSLRRHRLLHSNLLLVAAEHFCDRQKWDDVNRCLDSAQALVRQDDGSYDFLVKKWRGIAQYLKNEGNLEATKVLGQLREEAKAKGQWESVRQCDEVVASMSKDRERLQRLYFGTPFSAFRDSMLARWPSGTTLPSSYLWRPEPSTGGTDGGAVVDLLTGLVTGKSHQKGEALKVGQLLHRLLLTLCSDFYRPHRLAALHFQLYPGEYFNPVSSPFRVYEAVKRLRAWIDECGLPLTIDEAGGSYRLVSTGPCGIRIYKKELVSSRQAASLLRLRDKFPDAVFSVSEACEALEISVRSAQRLLEASVAEGSLTRVGKSRATRYGFPAETVTGQNSQPDS